MPASLTVRERIDCLLDPGSFHEIGALAGRAKYGADGEIETFQPANFVFGRGRIEGRPVVVGGDDFTVRGGAADASIRGKQVQSEQMANELRIPLVRLIDGTGGGGSVKTIETEGYTYVPANPAWDWVVKNMGTVPVVALGLGSVAGLGAARLATSHYSVMVEGISHMFIAGPPVVARLSGPITKDELGAADIHARAGAVDDVVASEAEAFARARRFLSYLPPSVYELPERIAPTDDAARRDPWLIEAVPHDRRKVYDMRRILNAVVDKDSLFEMGRKFGGSVITALARLDGWPVAVLASDPYFYGGGWTADASQKVDALRRPREHVPSADRASRRRAGLCHRRRGREGRHDSRTARAHSRRSIRRACRSAPSSSARCSAWRAPAIRRTTGCTIAMRGPRATGARCRSRAGSRRPIAPNSTPRRIATSCAPKSRSGSTAIARRSAPPRHS